MLVSMGVVTPYAGVWIEIRSQCHTIICYTVTPYAGVWIEISICAVMERLTLSLPTRECGLKSDSGTDHKWRRSHSLRGSVD